MTPLIVVAAITALVVIVILVVIAVFTRGRAGKNLDQQKYRTEWLKIENGLDRNNSATFQFALLAADNLLDQALTESGIEGEIIEEKLKNTKNKFLSGAQVLSARKTLQQTTGKPDDNINIVVVKRALITYKKALKELGAI